MNLIQLLKLLKRNFLLLLFLPLAVAVSVYFFMGNSPKEYISSALIFAGSSGNKTGGDETKVDFFAYNNLFDNMILLLKSRENIEETSLMLIARHIFVEYADSTIVSKESINELKEHINSRLWNELKDVNSEDSTFSNVKNHFDKVSNSPIKYLLKAHPNYSITTINNNLTATRRASSNVMELVYTSNDPGICKNTLDFIIRTFSRRYKELKYNENQNSIYYFQDQLQIAEDKLKNSEADLKEFITQFKILNYYEQGKYLDISKLEQEQDEEHARRLAKGLESNISYLESMFDNFDQKVKNIDALKELQKQVLKKDNELESLKLNKNVGSDQLAVLEKEIEGLRDSINQKTQKVFRSSNTDKGIPRNNVIETWLKLNLQYEEQNVALDVMQSRTNYLDRKISEFAPLGAELKKLEREVSVNENQYLSILHGLNMAFLQKYDLETTSHFKVIDKPYLPQSPVPHKRSFLVTGSFMVVSGLIFSILVALALFDPRIKTLKRAQKFSKMKSIASFPKIKKKSNSIDQVILLDWISKIAKNTVVSILNSKKPHNDYEFVTINSIKKNEGKSFITKQIAEGISFNYKQIAVLTTDPDSLKIQTNLYPNIEIFKYGINEHFTAVSSIEEILPQASRFDFILMELPAIIAEPIAVKLINAADFSLFILSVDRTWTIADQKAIELLKQTTQKRMGLILNRMDKDELVNVYGSLPYHRKKSRGKNQEIVSA